MKRNRPSAPKGTALLLALLVVLAVTFVMAGWATLLAQRVAFSEDFGVAQKRRLSVLNAENIGKQWARSALSSNAVPAVSVTLPGDWGRFTASTVAAELLNTTNMVGLFNVFGPMGQGGFVRGVSTIVSTDGYTNGRFYSFRSRSPLFGGYPLVIHTNSIEPAVSFTGLAVETNSSALIFAEATQASVAPSARMYQSPTNRIVRFATNSEVQAPISPYPFTPLISAPTGATSFSGSLPDQPPRSAPINNLDASMDAAFPSPPLIQDVLIPGLLSEYRVIGEIPTGVDIFEVELGDVDTSHGPSSLLGIGANPDAAPQQTGPNRSNYFYYGNTYELKYASSNVQYKNGTDPNWITLNADEEIISFLPDGTVEITSVGAADSVDIGFDAADRTVLFVPPQGQLLVIRPNRIVFNGNLGYSLFNQMGAAIFRRSEYMQPGGVSFVLLSSFGNDHLSQQRLSPANYSYRSDVRCLDGVNFLRLIELNTSSVYEITDLTSIPLLLINPAALPSLSLVPGAEEDSPALHYLRSPAIDMTNLSGPQLMWRQWMAVFSSEHEPGVDGPYLRFSYLDPNTLWLGLAAGNNDRPSALVLSGSGESTVISSTGAATWNLSATLLNAPVNFAPGGPLTLRGGLRINRNAIVSTNSISLEPNTVTGPLERFADRMGWIESWNQ